MEKKIEEKSKDYVDKYDTEKKMSLQFRNEITQLTMEEQPCKKSITEMDVIFVFPLIITTSVRSLYDTNKVVFDLLTYSDEGK